MTLEMISTSHWGTADMLTEGRAEKLCLALIKADCEEEVILLLNDAKLWESDALWRDLGDNENNYAIAGNQQSKSDAALVEKLINSIDARLTGECLKRNIGPTSNFAPPTVRYAVAQFIEDSAHPEKESAGRVADWPPAQRTRIANTITLAATGSRHTPCFTICDTGEGQTPDKVPETFMSLNKSNKLRIRFVQGKFNMGGTGVLRFCGNRSLQLIVTRRDPTIMDVATSTSDDLKWSFTVVRRDDPQSGERSSVYRYLAPLVSEGEEPNGVLRFSAEKLKIFPNKNIAYDRESEWGSLIKLYEYKVTGFASHILLGDGLLSRMELLLPDPALPMRFHECRDYKGHEGSFANNLTGIGVRLSDDKGKNMEPGFPMSSAIHVSGQSLTCTIYAFKKGKARTYRKNEGVIFVVNGQTHGALAISFFKGTKIGLSYLARSLLVKIDCSHLDRRSHEELFMNSRDKLCVDSDIRNNILESLRKMLKEHPALRELKNKRREEEVYERLADNKPLEDTLRFIVAHSRTLSSLFLRGSRLVTPFKTKKTKKVEPPYIGKKFPNYFHFKGKSKGVTLERVCHINMRCRLTFQTDVENNYFGRETSPGRVSVKMNTSAGKVEVKDYVGPTLSDGRANLTFELPHGAKVGDTITYIVEVTDDTQIEPFANECKLTVAVAAKKTTSAPKPKPWPPSTDDGDDENTPSGISLPNVIEISEENWATQDPPFDGNTALRVINVGETSADEEQSDSPEESKKVYDFFVNVSNRYLLAELKTAVEHEKIVQTQFVQGMVLTGLAFLHDEAQSYLQLDKDKTEEEIDIEAKIEHATRALAPFLIPMISALGNLAPDEEQDVRSLEAEEAA